MDTTTGTKKPIGGASKSQRTAAANESSYRTPREETVGVLIWFALLLIPFVVTAAAYMAPPGSYFSNFSPAKLSAHAGGWL